MARYMVFVGILAKTLRQQIEDNKVAMKVKEILTVMKELEKNVMDL